MDIQEFADALASKDLDRYSQWFADDIQLYTSIYEEPVTGKQASCQILPVVFSIFENFHYPKQLLFRSRCERTNSAQAGRKMRNYGCLFCS